MFIHEKHYVTRLCGERDIDSGEILETAFMPRKRDKGNLSVDWVECECVECNKRNINSSIDRLKYYVIIGSTCGRCICSLNVGLIRAIETKDGKTILDVYHSSSGKKSKKNPCHSLISPHNDEVISVEIQAQLAEIANQNWIAYL